MKLKWLLIVQWQKILHIQLQFNCCYSRKFFQENNLEEKNLQKKRLKVKLKSQAWLKLIIKNITFFGYTKVLFFKIRGL